MAQSTTLKTIISIPIEAALTQYAAMSGVRGWQNVLCAYAALNVLGGLVLMHESSNATDEDTRPKWLNSTADLVDLYQIGVLAYFGWWWCAGGYLIGAIGAAAYRARKPA